MESLPTPEEAHESQSKPVVGENKEQCSPNRSRYGRTHKPKISEDFYNIDDILDDPRPRKSRASKSPKIPLRLKSPIKSSEKVKKLPNKQNKSTVQPSTTIKEAPMTKTSPASKLVKKQSVIAFSHVTGDDSFEDDISLVISNGIDYDVQDEEFLNEMDEYEEPQNKESPGKKSQIRVHNNREFPNGESPIKESQNEESQITESQTRTLLHKESQIEQPLLNKSQNKEMLDENSQNKESFDVELENINFLKSNTKDSVNKDFQDSQMEITQMKDPTKEDSSKDSVKEDLQSEDSLDDTPLLTMQTDKAAKPSEYSKERKFFKSPTQGLKMQNMTKMYIKKSEPAISLKSEENKPLSNVEIEEKSSIDVSKVLKIVANHPDSPAGDASKGSMKSSLKTYGNKRKSFLKTEVIESFGLPDEPIVPVEDNILPERISAIDVDTTKLENVNVDTTIFNAPWSPSKANGKTHEGESSVQSSDLASPSLKDKSATSLKSTPDSSHKPTDELMDKKADSDVHDTENVLPEKIAVDIRNPKRKLSKSPMKSTKNTKVHVITSLESKTNTRTSQRLKSPVFKKSDDIIRNSSDKLLDDDIFQNEVEECLKDAFADVIIDVNNEAPKSTKINKRVRGSPRKKLEPPSETEISKPRKSFKLSGNEENGKKRSGRSRSSITNTSDILMTASANVSPSKLSDDNEWKAIENLSYLERYNKKNEGNGNKMNEGKSNKNNEGRRSRSSVRKPIDKQESLSEHLGSKSKLSDDNNTNRRRSRSSVRKLTENELSPLVNESGKTKKSTPKLSENITNTRSRSCVRKTFEIPEFSSVSLKIQNRPPTPKFLKADNEELITEIKREIITPEKEDITTASDELATSGRQYGKRKRSVSRVRCNTAVINKEINEQILDDKSDVQFETPASNYGRSRRSQSVFHVSEKVDNSSKEEELTLTSKKVFGRGRRSTSNLLTAQMSSNKVPTSQVSSNHISNNGIITEIKQEVLDDEILSIDLKNKSDSKQLETRIKSEPLDYEVGTIVWAKMGSFPYWPSMIAIDPETQTFMKTHTKKNTKYEIYHVRFFGDRGRRSWVVASSILPYKSKTDIAEYRENLKNEKRNKSIFQSYKVPYSIFPKWESAVNEADFLKNKPLSVKMEHFEVFGNGPKYKKKPKGLGKSALPKSPQVFMAKPENKIIKGRQSLVAAPTKFITKITTRSKSLSATHIENESTDNVIKVKEEPLWDSPKTPVQISKKRKSLGSALLIQQESNESLIEKKSANQTKTLSVKNSLSEKNSLPEKVSLSEKKGFSDKKSLSEKKSFPEKKSLSEKKISNEKKSEPLMSETIKTLQKSESTSEYSSDSEISFPVTKKLSNVNYTMEDQIALFKRNNLLRGLSKEKVCQVCEKPNGILKCKGRCNSLFHYTCANKVNDQSDLSSNECDSPSETNESEANTNVLEVNSNNCKVNTNGTQIHNRPDSETIANEDGSSNPQSSDHSKSIDKPESTNNSISTNIPESTNNTKSTNNTESIDNTESTDNPELTESTVNPESTVNSESVNAAEFTENTNEDNQMSSQQAAKSGQRELSIGEKIDLKMKEVMEKFEKGNIYADSTTDYTSSDENSEVDELRHKQIQHVTADHISFAGSATSSQATNAKFKCNNCLGEIDPPCFVCHKDISRKGSSIRQRCSIHQCGKFFHPECLKPAWPQTQWSVISTTKHKECAERLDTFVCPMHVCHICVSDDPRAAISRISADKVVKCLRCPATYHAQTYCIPAGTQFLSSWQIICPRHVGEKGQKSKGKSKKYNRTINTAWCFMCSKGGDIVCCETCPTSIHTYCLDVNLTDDDKFICEDCETGRLPLYDEIVWVKLGWHRWWPALILFPNEVPDNIYNLPHANGEFVVKFFGTNDHYWVSRGRVFLYQEGDKGHTGNIKKKVDAVFQTAIEEAAEAHVLKQEFKSRKEAEIKNGTKPPPYIRIKVNRPVGNVRQYDGNVSNTTPCECDPNQPNPCGPESNCLNRLLLTECDPEVCPAGNNCSNQNFEKRLYPPLVPYKTEKRGWGLKSLEPIKKGQFVIEYVGEMIDDQEYQRRIKKMHEQKEENYYFLTIDNHRMIDAGPKGNVARFMNHSCQPNCETQKWTVKGDTRVGLFAINDIAPEAEITFNYNLECVGKEKKICQCGAPNCSGFIGLKSKQEESQKKPKKILKKQKLKKRKLSVTPQVTVVNTDPCFVCGETGDINACQNKICTKFYHLKCVNLEVWPEGKWVCPWHNCNVCSKRTIRCCVKCTNSYCPVHSEGNVRYDKLLGFVCIEHDPISVNTTIEIANPKLLLRNENQSPTKETDVTSTTSDEIEQSTTSKEDVHSESPKFTEAPLESQSDVENTVTSTPSKLEEDLLQQDFPDTPNNNSSQSEGKTTEKRKRGRPKKSLENFKKKFKMEETQEKKAPQLPPKPQNILNFGITSYNSTSKEVILSSTVPTRHLRVAKSSSDEERLLKRHREYEKDLPIRKRSTLRCETSS